MVSAHLLPMEADDSTSRCNFINLFPIQADVGSAISVNISYTDDQGTTESVTSSAISVEPGLNQNNCSVSTSQTGDGHQIIGSRCSDVLVGQATNDVLHGKAGRDLLKGMPGNDLIKGGKNSDLLKGGNNNDILYGNKGKDHLYGQRGDDKLRGGAHRDWLKGGKDDDILCGGNGADRLDGGDHSDKLNGGKGADILIGGSGADIFRLSKGNDIIKDFSIDDGDVLRTNRSNDLSIEQIGRDLLITDTTNGFSTTLIGVKLYKLMEHQPELVQ